VVGFDEFCGVCGVVVAGAVDNQKDVAGDVVQELGEKLDEGRAVHPAFE